MHIALLSAEYPPQPGGVGDYTQRLAQELSKPGYNVTVITATDGQWMCHAINSGTSTPLADVPLGSPSLPWGWRCWRSITAALASVRPNLLHIQYQTGAYAMHPAINLLPWHLHGLSGSPPVVVTFHDLLEPYLFPKAGPLRRWVTLRLAADAAAVITTNPADAQQLAHYQRTRQTQGRPATLAALLRPPRLHAAPAIIPIGSNIPVAPPPSYERATWRSALGVRPDELLVAYFGLLSPSKGLDLLLAAFADLQPDLPVRLLVVGGASTAPQDRAYAATIAAQIARLGLYDRVHITGQVDAATVSAHLLAADCVALPFRDGASFRRGSLLAALSHGCTIVTTEPSNRQNDHAAGTRLEDGMNVLLIPPDNSAALATALRRLAADPVLRTRLGHAAHRLGEQFSWSAIAQSHLQIYTTLLSMGC